jgi:hypothetical protein
MSRRSRKRRHLDPRVVAGAGSTLGGPGELRPGRQVRDLLDRAPVRLRVEGDQLVGYGFGHQRIAIPRSSVRALGSYFIVRSRAGPRQGLVVLDDEDRMLLRAAGTWDEGDALRVFSSAAGLPAPRRRTGHRLWRRAPGYRRLRTQPHGAILATAVVTVGVLAACVLGAMAGVLLTQMLPGSFGAVRFLAGVLAVLAGLITGLVIAVRAVEWATSALRWTARLPARAFGHPVTATPPAPPAPRRGSDRHDWSGLAGLVVLAFTVFGPVVLAITIADGVRDTQLLDRLRRHGVTVTGQVYDTPAFSKGVHGDYSMTHHVRLSFKTRDDRLVTTPDPAIAGHRYVKGRPVQAPIVYDPAHPATAAVGEQLTISPWSGSRAGNLIFGTALTVCLAAYAPLWLRHRDRPRLS